MTEQEKEPSFYHQQYDEIEYHRVVDQLWYSYSEKSSRPADSGARLEKTYRAQGLIPQEIISQGEGVIQEFVRTQIEERIGSEKEEDLQRREYLEDLRYPMVLNHFGVILRGQIRANDPTFLQAELLEPYQGVTGLNFGWASAMSGRFIFNKGDQPTFSAIAIERGRGMLTSIYKREKEKAEHQEVNGLVEKLNRGFTVLE